MSVTTSLPISWVGAMKSISLNSPQVWWLRCSPAWRLGSKGGNGPWRLKDSMEIIHSTCNHESPTTC